MELLNLRPLLFREAKFRFGNFFSMSFVLRSGEMTFRKHDRHVVFV